MRLPPLVMIAASSLAPAPALAQGAALPGPVPNRPANDAGPAPAGPGQGGVSGARLTLADGATAALGSVVPTLDMTRGEIGGRAVPLRSFVVSGFASAGDEGAAARYVRGTAAGPMAVQDAAGTWFQLDLSGPVIPAGWWGVVAGDESKAAQNGIAINRAMAALGARSGGTLQLPAGDIWVDRTLDNRFSYVLVRGQGMGSSHDTGAPPVGTRILPTAPVTVLRHRSQTAAERGVPPAQNFKTVGGGFDNLMVDGAGIAPRLLHVTSVTHALHRLYLANAVSPGTEAALYDTYPDYRVRKGQAQQLGEAGDNQYGQVSLQMRQDPGRGTGSLDCVNFGGTSFNGNTSLMTGIEIICRHADGVGVRLSNADNLEFAFIRDQPVGGSGAALLVQAAVPGDSAGQITVRTISAGSAIKVEAVADRPGAVSVGDLHIIDLDGGNGTPMPVGPNIKVDNTGNATFVSTGSSLSGLALGNGVASAATARAYLANHPVFSAVVANQSNAGLAYLSNTTPYMQRVDTATNRFQFLGPDTHEFGTALRVVGAVGFNGAAPVGRCKLSGALPTDGSAGNAALATALNAVRSCLVTNGLAQ